MYCEERKQSFIRYCTALGADTQYQKKIRLLFSHTGEFENSVGADLVDMTGEQVKNLVESGALGKTRICTALCILRSYMRWYLHEGFRPQNNGILEYAPYGLEETRSSMVSSDRHLSVVLNKIFPAENENSMANLIRAFVWLTYAGVYIDEIPNLTKENFDLQRLAVKSGDRELKLSPYSIPSVLFAINSDSFSVKHPQYSSMERMQSDSIMRGSRSVLSVKDVANRILLAQQSWASSRPEGGETAIDFTLRDIYKSGVYFNMLSVEREGVLPDFSVDADNLMTYKKHKQNTQYKHYGQDATETNRIALSALFLEGYSRWKLAFSYA